MRPSLRGCGKSGFGGAAARVSFGPTNSASNCCCCRNARIISSDGGGSFLAMSSDGSRCEKFTTKIKIQIVASPVQIRRHGEISSRQINSGRVAVSATLNFGTATRRPSRTNSALKTSRRMASSFGAAVWCRSSKISRGVFIISFCFQRRGAKTAEIRGEKQTLRASAFSASLR